MVEIFKTNVESLEESQELVFQLLGHFPDCKINFDLDDCDKILRVEGNSIYPTTITEILSSQNYTCEQLF